MDISIVIPNFNGEKFIKDCLEAIFSSAILPDEIIVVDNASIDSSLKIIVNEYPMVKLIKLDQNFGFSGAVNIGIKAAKSKFVVLLNNDTVVEKDWLGYLYNCINSDNNIFSCSSKMIQYNNSNFIDDAGDEYTILGWAYKRGDGFNVESYREDKEVFSSCAGAAIYRKSVFDEIGYFDENFFAYLEDVDIGYRARIYGYKNVFCSKAQVFHVGSATSGSKYNIFKAKLVPRNNIYLIYKNMPLMQLIINFPTILIGVIIKYIFYYKRGLSKEYINGVKEALHNKEKIDKVTYKNKNFINYINIQLKLVVNCIKLVMIKLLKKPM